MKNSRSKIYGLILSGGRSTRMGSDKGLLEYHGTPQREYLYQILEQYCEKVFLSVRDEQTQEVSESFHCIVDQNEYKGPLNGILSAHKTHPEIAWLVLACDLPLLTKNTIKHLIKNRNPDKNATAYATTASGLPEPLIAIWEPKGLQKAMVHMETAQSSCPRKFLINSDIKLIYPKTDNVLSNANSREEYEQIKSILKR